METPVRRLQAALCARQLPQGGWPFTAETCQMALEPTCVALLTLRQGDIRRAQILIDSQRRDGGWGAYAGDDEPSGLTGLALLTLSTLGIADRARSRAVRWLLNNSGKEASWPWKWKFRTRDTRARFDPDKFGWPWQPGTCSWVVPTAYAVLAIKQAFPHRRPRKVAFRIRRGAEMLVDRACPGGGWNAGNGIVYDAPMAPHIDATAIALLALQGDPPNQLTTRSLAWLDREASGCEAPWSLAWSILVLHALGKPLGSLQRRLARLAEFDPFQDTATLAAVVLALDCAISCNPFKVIR